MDLRIFKRDLYRIRKIDTDAMNNQIQECKDDIKYYGDLLKKISNPISIRRLGTDRIIGLKIQIKYRTVMMKLIEERLKKGVLKDNSRIKVTSGDVKIQGSSDNIYFNAKAKTGDIKINRSINIISFFHFCIFYKSIFCT